MKKNILYILLFVMAAFQACQDDPAFPDPNFELQDQRVTVWRDTADVYPFDLKMDVPNKVESIELINALNYTVVEEITDFNGKSKFIFDYEIDLTPYDSDTVLNYIIKVVDQDQRTTNQGIRLDVQGFSFPEIRLVGGNTIAVAAPVYVVKGLITTGLNTLKSVSMTYEGNEQYTYTVPDDTAIYEMKLIELVKLGDVVKGEEYIIEIVITDDKGQVSTTPITVKKNPNIKFPTTIYYSNQSGNNYTIDLTYDSEDKMETFKYTYSNGSYDIFEFKYNNVGMVDTVAFWDVGSDDIIDDVTYWSYNFVDGTSQLTDIVSQQVDYDALGEISGYDDPEVEADDFSYDESGNITAFRTTTLIENVYYSDPFDLGESVFSEYWQSTGYMTNDTRRQHRVAYDPVLMPTYIKGMVPYFASSSAMMQIFNDLIWHKYLMTDTEEAPGSSSPYIELPDYTYETDEDGNITTLTKVYDEDYYYLYWGETATYSFSYE